MTCDPIKMAANVGIWRLSEKRLNVAADTDVLISTGDSLLFHTATSWFGKQQITINSVGWERRPSWILDVGLWFCLNGDLIYDPSDLVSWWGYRSCTWRSWRQKLLYCWSQARTRLLLNIPPGSTVCFMIVFQIFISEKMLLNWQACGLLLLWKIMRFFIVFFAEITNLVEVSYADLCLWFACRKHSWRKCLVENHRDFYLPVFSPHTLLHEKLFKLTIHSIRHLA